MDVETSRIYVRRDLKFFENEFPFKLIKKNDNVEVKSNDDEYVSLNNLMLDLKNSYMKL